ncbi:MAG: TRAP transporter small permease [Rhodocyclaceae bacterium]
MTEVLLAIERRVTALVSALAQILLVVAACLGFYQVITRFVLEAPSDWSEVATRTALVWMVYLACAVAFREGALAAVEILHDACRGRARRLLRRFTTFITLAFLALVAWQGFVVSYRVRFQSLAGLDISISWAYLAIPVGACFSMLAVLARHLDPHGRDPGGDAAALRD